MIWAHMGDEEIQITKGWIPKTAQVRPENKRSASCSIAESNKKVMLSDEAFHLKLLRKLLFVV